MTSQPRRDNGPSADNGIAFQRAPSDITETLTEQNTRDSLPKYYPKDHEVTRWLINQMRCRNGLHHLVNLANVQPSLLSSYFELFDQPHLYIEARTGPGMPAYSIKTVLYLTPLAIAIYFRLRSVLRLLLDTSGTRIHARARQEIDVNATCYVRRTKPRPGPFVMDEYSTTYPAIIAVRREFFTGLSMLMAANFHPQAPIGIVERLGTTRETTFWFVDLLDFCVKLLNTRPGVDVIGLLQTISYRGVSDPVSSMPCYYDPCVYDIRQTGTSDEDSPGQEVWCSLFHRLVRRGASRNYSNCGNRLIGLLENIMTAGFFRQKYMPKGPVEYDSCLVNRRSNRVSGMKKINPEMINRLSGQEKEAAKRGIAADRDACLCLLTLWLERVRNRCLDRQAQRLFRLLTTALAETDLLHDFLFPPADVDITNVLHPYWLAAGLSRMLSKPMANCPGLGPGDFLDEDANEVCELEPPQVNEIRQEVGILGHAMGLVDYSDRLYNLGYPRLVEIMPFGGAIGDAVNYTRDPILHCNTRDGFKNGKGSPHDRESQARCASEDNERQIVENHAAIGFGELQSTGQRKPGTPNNRAFLSNPNRTVSTSPPMIGTKYCAPQSQIANENKNNVTANSKQHVTTAVTTGSTGVTSKQNVPNLIPQSSPILPNTATGAQSRSVERMPQPRPAIKRPGVWRTKPSEKQQHNDVPKREQQSVTHI